MAVSIALMVSCERKRASNHEGSSVLLAPHLPSDPSRLGACRASHLRMRGGWGAARRGRSTKPLLPHDTTAGGNDLLRTQ
jgi:hypothetical protein